MNDDFSSFFLISHFFCNNMKIYLIYAMIIQEYYIFSQSYNIYFLIYGCSGTYVEVSYIIRCFSRFFRDFFFFLLGSHISVKILHIALLLSLKKKLWWNYGWKKKNTMNKRYYWKWETRVSKSSLIPRGFRNCCPTFQYFSFLQHCFFLPLLLLLLKPLRCCRWFRCSRYDYSLLIFSLLSLSFLLSASSILLSLSF